MAYYCACSLEANSCFPCQKAAKVTFSLVLLSACVGYGVDTEDVALMLAVPWRWLVYSACVSGHSWAPCVSGGWQTERRVLGKPLVGIPAWRVLGRVPCACFPSQASASSGRTVVGGGEEWHRWGCFLGAAGRKLLAGCCLAGLRWRKNGRAAGSMAQLKY